MNDKEGWRILRQGKAKKRQEQFKPIGKRKSIVFVFVFDKGGKRQ